MRHAGREKTLKNKRHVVFGMVRFGFECGVMVQEHEGQGAQLKHEAAVIQFDEMDLEGYGPFR